MATEKMNKRIEALPSDIYAVISQIDQIKGKWSDRTRLGPRTLERLQRSALITSAGASTRIEGSRMSDDEIRQFLGGIKTTKMRERDAEEVQGYVEALSLIQDNYEDIPLAENYLRQIHQVLLGHSSKDERYRGKYKQMSNDVVARDVDGKEVGVVFRTMSPLETPEAMRRLFIWLNKAIEDGRVHPLLVVANFVVEFLRIHPFMDGNGRTSRLMTDLLMLKTGFKYVPYVSMERIIEATKAEYYVALRRSQETFGGSNESIEDWVRYWLEVCLEQAREAEMLLTGDNVEAELSGIQQAVYEIVMELGEFAVRDVEARTDIPRSTIRQALEKLEKLGVIEAMGAGRGARYRVR